LTAFAATSPPVANRISQHFAPSLPSVPATPQGWMGAWGNALFAAAMFYQARLAHPDPDVAERAARALFGLE
jgi:hypothetical protein